MKTGKRKVDIHLNQGNLKTLPIIIKGNNKKYVCIVSVFEDGVSYNSILQEYV